MLSKVQGIRSFWKNFLESGNCVKLEKFLKIGDPDFLNREISYECAFSPEESFKRRFKLWHEVGFGSLAVRHPLVTRMDIGACYNQSFEGLDAEQRKFLDLKPVAKEIIFDLDLSDYNTDVRTCNCVVNNTCCNDCWPIAACAIKTVEHILYECFGYQDVKFFFSGRRGFHCWVRDKEAVDVDFSVREAILKFMVWESEKDAEHPALVFPYNNYLFPTFQLLCQKQDLYKKCAELIGEDFIGWNTDNNQCPTNHGREFYNNLFLKQVGIHRLHKVILKMLLPRLDCPVTKEMKHLIRAPWTIHEKTGKMVTPIEGDPFAFDPEGVKSWF